MSKISLGQLDLLALQQYFEIVAGFRKKDDKALDVTNVGTYTHPTVDDSDKATEVEESPVLANQVAMAALDELGFPIAITNNEGVILVPERNTVLNSMMLGGVKAEDFLQRVEAGSILTDVNQATYNISDDIRNLKDELYQLKNQLIKSGAIKDSNVYNGFIDSFIESKEKHTISTGVQVETVTGNTAYVKSIGDLRVGDIVVFENNGNFNIQKIMSIGMNEFDVDLEWEGSTGPLEAHQNSFVTKSLGLNKNGKFVFGILPEEGRVPIDEKTYIVKDGIDRIKVYELEYPGHGYGTEIKIPASLKDNVISKVQVSLAVKGRPGSIHGEFWKWDDLAQTFIQTEYVTEPIKDMEASGWFNNFSVALPNELPVQPGERYILIFEAGLACSEDDKWLIGGFTDADCTDDVHNDSYIQSNDMLYKSAEEKDMFLTLTTKQMTETQIKKLSYGLYTCNFDVYNSVANRLRVELCINKEGLFKVKENISTNLANGKITEIPLDTQGNTVFRDLVFAKDDNVVIGKEIGLVSSVGTNNNNIIPQQDMYVVPKSDVYRVGYELQAIASNKVLDPTATGVVERYDDAEIYPLKLVGVVPGRDLLRPDQSSDRLIFECEFYDQNDLDNIKLLSFNHIQLQVRWFSNVDNNIIQMNEALEGAILDITASVDQAYTTNPNK